MGNVYYGKRITRYVCISKMPVNSSSVGYILRISSPVFKPTLSDLGKLDVRFLLDSCFCVLGEGRNVS